MSGWDEEVKKTLRSCGSEVFIGHYCVFTAPDLVQFKDRVRIDPFGLFTTELLAHSNVHICSHVVIGGGRSHRVELGEWSFIGYGSKLFCASEDYSGEYGPVNTWGRNRADEGGIVFERFSGVAADVIVFPAVTFPEGAVVAAKSLVHPKYPLQPWTVHKGVPALPWRLRNREKILEKAADPGFLR